MKWGMEILSPNSYFPNPGLFLDESRGSRWTPAENKAFENALAMYDESTPYRWEKVAAMVPGKTVEDVKRQFKELEDDVSSIEAGLFPVPGYNTSLPFTLEWGGSHGYDGFKQHCHVSGGRKSSSSGKSSDQERKKGVPWTEEEHKLFLMGLKKYGKGDWRNISRNYVITRTPTQVASHAQKYFLRQISGGKDKRRASIHDITTVNLSDRQTPSSDTKKPRSPEQSNSSPPIHKLSFQWNQTVQEPTIGFNSIETKKRSSSPNLYGSDSYMQGHNLQISVMNESFMASRSMLFQMETGLQLPNE